MFSSFPFISRAGERAHLVPQSPLAPFEVLEAVLGALDERLDLRFNLTREFALREVHFRLGDQLKRLRERPSMREKGVRVRGRGEGLRQLC